MDTVPVPTHWINIEDNHVPEDTQCLIEFVDKDGEINLGVAYKSSRTKSWIAGEDIAIDELHHVIRYSIITDRFGISWPAT